jgi:ring-1,2-phenylacetyl-CoA epoxidase subunit PaaC
MMDATGFEPIAMDLSGAGDGRERALALLLLSMADDEFVIGFSDSEWTGIGPILEEDVAISSLAQDELGHAQALYQVLVELVADGRDVDSWAYDRPPEGYLHARLLDHPRGDWAMTIARRYLYDSADAFRLEALASSSHAPLAELVAKLRREERYHLMHVDAWLERLAHGGHESRERLVSALEALAPDAGTVLTPLPGEAALLRHGILERPWSEIAARWRSEVDARFAALGLRALPSGDVSIGAARSHHSDAFRALHADFTSVRRLEPGATW